MTSHTKPARATFEECRALLAEWERSGLRQHEFSEQRGIPVRTFEYYRRQQLRRSPPLAGESTPLIPVHIAPPGPRADQARHHQLRRCRLRVDAAQRPADRSWLGVLRSLPGAAAARGQAGLMLLGVGPATKIYLAVAAVDLRKGFNGLYGLVRDQLQQDPLSGHPVLVLPTASARI